MTADDSPVYEVVCHVGPDAVDAVAAWLEHHTGCLRDSPGVRSIHVLRIDGQSTGPVDLVCQFRLAASGAAADSFVNDTAPDFEAALSERFGGQLAVTARLLAAESLPPAAGISSACQNCGARLRGQYCAECGQRSRSRMISLWELVREAFDDLFDVDSRLWRTVVPLLFRPGLLTRDYLRGRQARYMPPFRTYLVLSLLFFVIAFFDPRETFGLLFEPLEESPSPAGQSDAAEERRKIIGALAGEGIFIPEPRSAESPAGTKAPAEERGLSVEIDTRCDIESMGELNLPDWLGRRLTPQRLQHICEQTLVDNGRALINSLLETIPAALIVLLPIMAFVLKLLYPLSRRYYVEHLLFFIHVHAFFFLILTLEVLFTRAAALISLPDSITTLVIVAGVIYIPAYLFVAMRRVYRQGRFITSVKYVALASAYLTGLLLTMLGSLAIAAFSI